MTELARTPLFDEHVRAGARMVPFAGYEMPVQYAGIIEEHAAVREHAGLFDVSHMAEFRVFGIGARDALQRLFTNDIDRLAEVGAGQYTLLCDESGGIIDDCIVYRSGELEYLVIANASNRETDRAWIEDHLDEGVEFIDESDRTGLLALQGPEAIGIISELIGNGGAEIPGRFHLGTASLGGIPVLLARTGYTGEDGVEIICHSDRAADVWRLAMSFPQVSPCGLGARDTLRLEMGYVLHGTDIDRTTDPVSAGLGWAVKFAKGDFIGRDAIAAVKEAGPIRKLVALRLAAGTGVPRHGYPVLSEGQEVGVIASGSFSPTLGHGIATAWLPAELATPGTKLQVAIRSRTVQAEVVKAPFVRGTSLDTKG